jgi:glycosyltransferase involved in cell wall biosynthesis
MNTGVQRVVRGLWRGLSTATAAMPVLWDPGLVSYCALSRRERGFLERPFGHGGKPHADAEPGRRANPVPVFSKLARRLGHLRRRLDLPARLTADDTLFVPEIFQDNRLMNLPAMAGRTAARRVVVCHDAIVWRRPDINPPARQAGFLEYLNALSRFDRVIAVSRETETDLLACWQEHGQSAAPVSVLGWPVGHAESARPAVRPPPESARPMILCVGTFEPRKNHLVLLQAAGMLWEQGVPFELALVGRTTAQWGERVLAAIDALKAAGRPVRWLRHVDDDTLRAAYEECAFTVFPSLVEGFGLPILESLWHGRPCVCGANGAIGEVSAGGGCLNVDQTQPATLAEGMKRLLMDASLRQRLCREAAERPLETWNDYAARVLPLLQ